MPAPIGAAEAQPAGAPPRPRAQPSSSRRARYRWRPARCTPPRPAALFKQGNNTITFTAADIDDVVGSNT